MKSTTSRSHLVSHHHAAKSFRGRSAPAKGGMLDAKAAEAGMLLDKIEKTDQGIEHDHRFAYDPTGF